GALAALRTRIWGTTTGSWLAARSTGCCSTSPAGAGAASRTRVLTAGPELARLLASVAAAAAAHAYLLTELAEETAA
ncbi:hypothetical protein ABTX86_34740, partial [Streptomyces anulatus]